MTFMWNALRGASLAGLIALAACGEPETEVAETETMETETEVMAEPADGPAPEFDIGWSIYAGWMPWPYAEQEGIIDKWAEKYGIVINMVQVNDYIESLNQYTAGTLDGVTSTNMDALTIPAAGGRDTTVLIMGDYSNGNDGIVLKEGDSIADLDGQTVNLVELSVSHYLLARALEMADMTMPQVSTVNTSDADMVGAWQTPEVTAVVTWNPPLSEILAMDDGTEVFDSSQIPNEIQDLMVVSTETLAENPELGMALVGAWYETMGVITGDMEEEATAAMASIAGTTPDSFAGQLATTYLYTDPAAAVAYVTSPDLIEHSDLVRQFSFDQGLYGPGADSVDAIGMEFPGGETLGDTGNIQLRFDSTYMQMAADGSLE